ncbi:N-acetyltransferase family protein [Sulfurospirillum diekertiae]|uniref:N-acetyltransferase n=1 Tax=Sulfurospirillum diekertiae TaxID=1854492 RepID=A0A1Y0HMT7_9BACT|nr:GNAT family N-acetyltransferase [Sulfurospirillum diekertiae]ARU48645.1 Putative phosphinothricin acetyltransferase YwnH [Sulfurospirillum diekertiae]ASC93475.1 Putative phosphinothricin acetyltransferase YwnH [Sulfurospirillum diekertiae]QIR77159.1 N-acetyltransferase [Sulfurospirillum diekertiae]QIR79774.1 N-acetyltransferase family protein [Sulfurospirillum diekertiae]
MLNELRHATLEDLPEIIKIYNEAIKDGISTADSKTVSVEDKIEWFKAHDALHPILVKEYHGRIIAWISLQPFYANLLAYAHSARINIYIDKNFQGKKLGQQFLCEAIEQAKSYEIKTLLALIFSENTPSLKLFKKLGFKEWGNLNRIATIEGMDKDLLILGHRIQE